MMRVLTRYLLLYLISISCNQKPDGKQQSPVNHQQARPHFVVSAKGDSLSVDTFNITRLIPEFSQDISFHAISGVTIGTDIQKTVMYSIYQFPKNKVFKIVSRNNKRVASTDKKILPTYSDLSKVDSVSFFTKVYSEYEQNQEAQKFYDKLRSLKKYDIYIFNSYGYLHWLFFDRNSDTIYQRTQLLTF